MKQHLSEMSAQSGMFHKLDVFTRCYSKTQQQQVEDLLDLKCFTKTKISSYQSGEPSAAFKHSANRYLHAHKMPQQLIIVQHII